MITADWTGGKKGVEHCYMKY